MIRFEYVVFILYLHNSRRVRRAYGETSSSWVKQQQQRQQGTHYDKVGFVIEISRGILKQEREFI